MPTYPYRCAECSVCWQEKRLGADCAQPAKCPQCGLETTQQDYRQKNIGGFISTEGDWSGGKLVPQLGPGHPDAMVTSKRQMEKVYRRHGISLETGHFTSREAQVKATVPRSKRKGLMTSNTAIGGVQEEN